MLLIQRVLIQKALQRGGYTYSCSSSIFEDVVQLISVKWSGYCIVKCFATTFLYITGYIGSRMFNDDEVGLIEKPEDKTYITQYYIEMRPEAQGVLAN